MENHTEPDTSFTGRARRRTTKTSVLIADRVARLCISVGGIGTIVAVLGVCVFLVWVVAPLFLPARVGDLEAWEGGWSAEPLAIGVDEYQVLTWVLLADGRIEVRRLDDGELLDSRRLYDGRMTSASFLVRSDTVTFGTAEGLVQEAAIGFSARIVDPADLPAAIRGELERRPAGSVVSYGSGVVQLTGSDQARIQDLNVEMGAETRVGDGPVRLVRHVVRTGGPLIVALAESPPAAGELSGPPAPGLRLVAISGEERSDFLTGKTSLVFDDPVELPFEPLRPELPAYLAVSGSGSDVYVAWEHGEVLRLKTPAHLGEAFLAEKGRLVDDGVALTAFGFLLGNTTLVWGDSRGRVEAGFPVRLEEYVTGAVPGLRTEPRATTRLAATKQLAELGVAARSLAPSARSRLLLTGFDDGRIRLSNVTNAAELRTFRIPESPTAPPGGDAVTALLMSPKEDGFVALAGGRIVHARLDPRYPEAGFAAFFRPVWYEGYSAPQHLWQSSSGSDDFEPKLGLYPLIFGTVKATVYSMLFGAPLALLAALFTSEFLERRAKAVLKPTIELMASLPSVVLGFLAALVIAPFLEDLVPATLAAFFILPVTFLLGAYVWQLVPARFTLPLAAWRFAFLVVAVPVGLAAAVAAGPRLEKLLFAGDLKAWLDWEPGGDPALASSIGGWMLLWLPLSALATFYLMSVVVGPWMRDQGVRWDRRRFAVMDLARFAVGLVVLVALALALSAICDGLGFDPRGGYLDTYVQRNALIVGFVMGFAVIPIIYTLAEDALASVPEHLRSASLGAGATPWQTAVRIVIPTAMSGLFSAMMVGLGRAVGETMIVLMAAGNTPVMKWNLFEGFRTLSANIAVELPEAVQGSTHYRTLFLAALVLFVLTFLVNTVAEVVRLRFRKRAYQL